MAEKKHFKVVSLDKAPPKLRGAVYEELLAEKYPTIRWNFSWENYVVVGVPDGITDDFVYEFKLPEASFFWVILSEVLWLRVIFMGTFLGVRISEFRFML